MKKLSDITYDPSSIRVNGRNVHLGYFANAEDASEFYLLAKQLVHKELLHA